MLPVQRTPAEGASAVTVLVVHADPFVREAVRVGLTRLGVERTLPAGSVAAVQDLLARRAVGQLALVSAGLGADTAGVIGALLGHGWHRVMLLTPTRAAEPVIATAVRAGATGALSGPAADPAGPVGDPAAARTLTGREIQVITLVADGCTNKEIAGRLSLSALTVKNHLARIGRKLGARDRAHLVAVACRAGIIS